MNDGNTKQQIVEKIKQSSNILVTVSDSPSVDELSAALGLTLLINKLDKHATAVFSGAIPPAITFLDPQKTFENTVDSLRDFIIALDKEKADHLRYKVEGDVVKIFITPYRTTITDSDLEFSQGDYNVELVIGLGVRNKDSLDQALAAHGRILHDATVATISAGGEKSELGSIDWHEENASSLSEMLVSLGDSLKSGDKPLLDEQIATAFLTGIVAATDRFSNNRTSSRVMTMAAQLMGAGANQQLIASKLEEAHEIDTNKPADTSDEDKGDDQGNADGTTDLSEGKSTKVKRGGKKPAEQPEAPKPNDGSLNISHEAEGDVDEVAAKTEAEQQAEAAKTAEEELAKASQEVQAKNQDEAAKEAEAKLADQLSDVAPTAATSTLSVADMQKDLAAASADVDQAAELPPVSTGYIETPLSKPEPEAPSDGPSMGGTLNATAEEAAEEKRREEKSSRNHTILNHPNEYIDSKDQPNFQSPLNSSIQPSDEPPVPDPFNQADAAPEPDTAPTAPAKTIDPPTLNGQTLADIDKQNRETHVPAPTDTAAAMDAALAAAAPVASLPPLPDYSTLPPLPPAPEFGPAPAPTPADSTPVDTGSLSGALPPDKLEDMLGTPPATPPPSTPPAPNDPGQFRIPGQQ